MPFVEKISKGLTKQDLMLILLLKISLLLVFLKSLFAWFLWELNPYIVAAISIFFSILFCIARPSYFPLKKEIFISVLLLVLVEFYCVRGSNINGYFGTLLTTIPIIFVLLLKDTIKIDLLFFLTSAIALILFVSLCAWILFLAGVQLPYSVVNFNDGQYWYNNYFFFLYNLNPSEIIPRFSGIFLEPGHLGVITSFLLFANHFALKRKEVLVLLVVTIFTFSLAAYLLLAISISVFLLMKSKKPFFYFALWLSFILIGYYFFVTLNHGDNIVNNLIIERLQVVDGDLAGNNRFSSSMDSYFEGFLKSDNLYTGISNSKYESLDLGPNAGYKVFFLQNGILGTSLLFLFYLSLVFSNKSKEALFFLFVYVLAFFQRSYALWECELLIFITAVSLFKTMDGKKKYGSN
jgi:hypothetical protein